MSKMLALLFPINRMQMQLTPEKEEKKSEKRSVFQLEGKKTIKSPKIHFLEIQTGIHLRQTQSSLFVEILNIKLLIVNKC